MTIEKKEYFTVKMEMLVPVTRDFRVLAESPEQAMELASKLNIQQPIRPPFKCRNLKATVYRVGSSMIEFIKNFT